MDRGVPIKRALRLVGTARWSTLLLILIASTTLAHAQMPQPDPSAYDTAPVLLQQVSAPSVHFEILRSGDAAPAPSESRDLVVSVTVSVNGRGGLVHVVRGPGLGQDEEAVKSMRQERFKPALKDGKPVPATILVKVTFDRENN
jgi:hypothetical protein